jgi:hypothetical protein
MTFRNYWIVFYGETNRWRFIIFGPCFVCFCKAKKHNLNFDVIFPSSHFSGFKISIYNVIYSLTATVYVKVTNHICIYLTNVGSLFVSETQSIAVFTLPLSAFRVHRSCAAYPCVLLSVAMIATLVGSW